MILFDDMYFYVFFTSSWGKQNIIIWGWIICIIVPLGVPTTPCPWSPQLTRGGAWDSLWTWKRIFQNYLFIYISFLELTSKHAPCEEFRKHADSKYGKLNPKDHTCNKCEQNAHHCLCMMECDLRTNSRQILMHIFVYKEGKSLLSYVLEKPTVLNWTSPPHIYCPDDPYHCVVLQSLLKVYSK